MKSYTDVKQSKALAKILPLNIADCCYIKYCTSDNSEWRYEGQPPMFLGDIPITEIEAEHIPCWSLAALLNMLPSGKALIHDIGNHGYKCICNNIDTDFYDNPVDACYEMILILHKKGLL